jgi:hypothetical protein
VSLSRLRLRADLTLSSYFVKTVRTALCIIFVCALSLVCSAENIENSENAHQVKQGYYRNLTTKRNVYLKPISNDKIEMSREEGGEIMLTFVYHRVSSFTG